MWDPTDVIPVNIFKMTSLSSGAARDINLDVQMTVGTGARVEQRSLVAFSMELPAVASFTQNDFEWFENADSVTLTNVWGNPDLAENADIRAVPVSNDPLNSGQQVRLQINITVADATLSATAQAFKLQYKAGTDESCASGSWTDVGAKASGVIWRLFDNASIGDSTTEVNQISTSDVAEYYSEINPSGTNPNAVTAGQDMEWDWPIEHNGAVDATTYAFRMVESDDTVLTYTAGDCPTLETAPGTANLMRHGNFFVDGVEKGFYWAD